MAHDDKWIPTHLRDFVEALEALDGKTFHVNATSEARPSRRADPEFDRAVRESLDRAHRRATIAGG